MATQPLISCICPTYGRPPDHTHLLEEAIESFLRQSYRNKELLVLNDCGAQELTIGSEAQACGVRIVNEKTRYATLGEKYNAAIRLATGAFIMPWEDDDLSLPWRIASSVLHVADADWWTPARYWFWHNRLRADHGMGICHNCAIFRRTAWEQVGGYAATTGNQDAEMAAKLRGSCREAVHDPLPIEEWSYIYRWGVSPTHLSGRKPHQDFYEEVGRRTVQAGRFELSPHWAVDYEELSYQYLDSTTKPPTID